jgi:hypothetical protein
VARSVDADPDDDDAPAGDGGALMEEDAVWSLLLRFSGDWFGFEFEASSGCFDCDVDEGDWPPLESEFGGYNGGSPELRVLYVLRTAQA